MTTSSSGKRSIEEIADGLSEMELELFMGKATGWGSWMFGVGGDLCAKGLGRKHDGSISFDTPLAAEVRAHILHRQDG